MSHPGQQDHYVDHPRPEVAKHIPKDARSALDVGCARGGFGLSLRSALGPGGRVVGVEAVSSAAAAARFGHGFDEVIEGYFPDALSESEERFDLITFNDVLEHIVEPWDVLNACHERLNPNGKILTAIPNVKWLPNVLNLLRGRWEYTDQGILDRTHVRFFTRSSIRDMFASCGYNVIACRGENRLRSTGNHSEVMKTIVRTILDPLVGDSRYLHFVVLAEPMAGAPPRT